MKKKQVKKLELHRETVRYLEDEKLHDAAAGHLTFPQWVQAGKKTDPRTTC